MVEVFRKSEDLYDIARQAIDIGAKVLWGQIGVVDHDAARLAEEAGLKVVMDRCPKIELFRPFWKPKLILASNETALQACQIPMKRQLYRRAPR